jgi:hypothetical protein
MQKAKTNGRSTRTRSSIDSDGHVRETDQQIMEYISAGYRSRRDAMVYFPLVPHHGWHRSIPPNDFRHQDFPVPDWLPASVQYRPASCFPETVLLSMRRREDHRAGCRTPGRRLSALGFGLSARSDPDGSQSTGQGIF